MIRVLSPLLLACALVAATSFPAGAQAKRPPAAKSVAPPAPTHQAWSKTVEAFATALSKGDLGAVGTLLAPRATVRQFDGVADEEVWRIFERVPNASLVGHHAYAHPPLVMAADLAADFKKSKVVPDAAKARFIIDDDSEMKRANAIAVQWLEQVLEARHGALVGLVVLWAPRAGTGGDSTAREPVFVLLKGEETGPGVVKVRTVLYGMPVSADGHP